MGRVLAAAACLLLAGCEKSDAPAVPVAAGTAARTLEAAPVPTFPSYEVFCTRVGDGTCKGEWEGHLPGTSALGPYRFVAVEYSELRDGEGTARDVFLELKTARGFSYLSLGRTRPGRVATSIMVKNIVDRPGALEVQTVFRTQPRFTHSDYFGSNFLVEAPKGLAVVQLALGKIVGDETGRTTGSFGEAQWKDGKVIVKGASVTDGEWAISLP